MLRQRDSSPEQGFGGKQIVSEFLSSSALDLSRPSWTRADSPLRRIDWTDQELASTRLRFPSPRATLPRLTFSTRHDHRVIRESPCSSHSEPASIRASATEIWGFETFRRERHSRAQDGAERYDWMRGNVCACRNAVLTLFPFLLKAISMSRTRADSWSPCRQLSRHATKRNEEIHHLSADAAALRFSFHDSLDDQLETSFDVPQCPPSLPYPRHSLPISRRPPRLLRPPLSSPPNDENSSQDSIKYRFLHNARESGNLRA